MTMRVLVTDAHKHTLAIVRSLGRAGIEVDIAAYEEALPSYSRYCRRHFVCHWLDDESGYVDSLEAILRARAYDVLIPVSHGATHILSRHKARLSNLTRLEVADIEKIEIGLSKKKTYEIARSIGVPCPETIYPESFEDLDKISTGIKYPVVIKGLYETGKGIVAYAYGREELLREFHRICQENNFTAGNLPMLQEYVKGGGYGFFALYQHGVCKRVFMHRRIREYPVTGGVSTCAESFYDPRLKDYGMRLLDALGWHGVAMVEFKGDERNGDYKLMELNPKFWGSLDLAIAAGVDFPYFLVKMAMGKELAYSEKYSRNLRFHWPLGGDIQHVLENRKSIIPFSHDLISPSVRSNIDVTDLKPNLTEVYRFFIASILKYRLFSGAMIKVKRFLAG